MKSIRVAVAVAVAGVALTACSSPMKAGSAAVVGSERISSADLDKNVQEYQAALEQAKLLDQVNVPLNQLVLWRMGKESGWRQLAAKHNIQVPESAVDAALKDPGEAQSPEYNLLGQGVAPANARGYLRAQLAMGELQRRFAGSGDAQAAQAKWTAEINSVKPVFSPRYGTFDPERLFVDSGRFGKLPEEPQQGAQG
ncbi:hypothetical protein HII36_21720 [Nonomuraea sp. NN258]|uniref:SurA N-terminal domain-containing protein n=1 Tax=Nonomuraea antri TaxID=2730852 RepID=UPI0015691878|nr:SurA N-terminal domain-containing protein [Nonomuraea antri]NRQ34452.1 hypothetical protein [Nonomuraea antri]